MIQQLADPVSVTLSHNHKNKETKPISVFWAGRTYPILKIGLHHTYRQGRTLYHVFSVVGNNIFFRLVLNTTNLSWRLTEVSDGIPD